MRITLLGLVLILLCPLTLVAADNEGIPAADALVGAWSSPDFHTGSPTLAEWVSLTFYADGTYIHVESDDPDDDCDNGGGTEYGTYSYEAATGQLTVTPDFDENGCLGPAGDSPVLQYTVTFPDGNLRFPDGFVLNRVVDSQNLIVGGWWMNALDNSSLVSLTMLPDGRYIHWEKQQLFTIHVTDMTTKL